MKVVFGSIITEGHGKLGGSIIQQSYGGYQMRNLKQPLKKPSMTQSKNRTLWKQVTGSWGQLSSSQRDSWNAAAPGGVSGFQLYNSTNMILVGLGFDPLTDYVAPVTPPVIILDFVSADITTTPFKQLDLNWDSPDDSVPGLPWWPYGLWSGFSTPGSTTLSRTNRLITKEGEIAISTSSLNAHVGDVYGANMANFVPGTKANFSISFINTETGQIVNVANYSFLYP